MISFASDNYAPVHEDVIERIKIVNQGHEPSYGADSYTQQAIDVFRQVFEDPDLPVYFMFNGTGANTVGIFSCLKPYECILTVKNAHVEIDECGALEQLAGAKIIALESDDGKLTVDMIRPYLDRVGDQHSAQLRLVSITQCTEYGTVYSLQELKELTDYCHQQGLYVHMDGSRLSNAAAYLGVGFKELTKDVGIDILSFGGTKNGLMLGEAVVFFNDQLGKDFKYFRKQGMQLASKMRYIAAQFLAFFANDLWYKNAHHANQMAKYFAEKLEQFPQVRLTQQVQSNMIFAVMPRVVAESMQDSFHFYIRDLIPDELRLVCSFDTSKEQIDSFIDLLAEKLQEF